MSIQLGLYDVLSVYGDDPLSNEDMYQRLQETFEVPEADIEAQVQVGSTDTTCSHFKRSVRWSQQSLKQSGLLERVGPKQWRRTGATQQFTQLIGSHVVLAYHTDMGLALWGDIHATAEVISEPIQLYFSSPPYPLAVQRSYGNVHVSEYVAWLCDALAPVVEKLADGGVLSLNLSNDIFGKNSPHRPSYLARLTVALEDKFNLYLMDTIAWSSNKAPGPMQHAQKDRVQLYTRWEPVVWFTNNPCAVTADNRRIEMDGMPGNVWNIGNRCEQNRKLIKQCKSLGLPSHDAMFPLNLAKRAIEFWTEPGQLVVDLMSGTNTFGYMAGKLGRKWVAGEQNAQFLLSGTLRWSEDSQKPWISDNLLRACS